MSDLMVAALEWADKGVRVFPLWWPTDGHCSCPDKDCASPAKHPITTRGFHDATTDPDQITTWWTTYPNANIGIVTGEQFDVIDIDGAAEAWRTFTDLRGTPLYIGVAMSGRASGGFHYYTQGGGKKTVPSGKRGLPKGVEIKAVGGYVVAPPSVHISGARYRWILPYDPTHTYGEHDYLDWYDLITTEPEKAQSAPTITSFAANPDRDSAYGAAVLKRACVLMTSAGEGSRWTTLVYEAAPLVARAVNGGCLDRTLGIAQLMSAASASGLSASEAKRVPELIARLEAEGIKNPIAPPVNPVDVDAWVQGLPDETPPATYIEQATERERTSWWPRDLEGVLSGDDNEPAATYLCRKDGQALFYPGRINGLIGESESGKTWVALLAVTQTLAINQHVLYLDFEDSAAGIVSRLRSMSATNRDLAYFHYISPDENLAGAAVADLSEALELHQPALIVLDGFNAAMTLLGKDLNSNTDATEFAQRLLRPLTRAGACLIYVDHVPKNRDQRGKGGIGAQAKRAMTTGCAIAVDIRAEFGRGQVGRLDLRVDKDRPGHVRAISAFAKNAGTAVLTSEPDGGVHVEIVPPDDVAPAKGDGTLPRNPELMERITDWMAEQPGQQASNNAIVARFWDKAKKKPTRDDVRGAVKHLVQEKFITEPSKGNSSKHALLARFDMTDDLLTGVES